jgi:hypothetical protein
VIDKSLKPPEGMLRKQGLAGTEALILAPMRSIDDAQNEESDSAFWQLKMRFPPRTSEDTLPRSFDPIAEPDEELAHIWLSEMLTRDTSAKVCPPPIPEPASVLRALMMLSEMVTLFTVA